MPRHTATPFLRRKSTAVAAATGLVATVAAGVWLSNAFATPSGSAAEKPVRLPGANMSVDYQLGGAYPPAPGVRAVSRDRSAKPVPGLYNICYVNAFQAQPDALGWWQKNHPDLILKNKNKRPVIDENWDEALLDTSTADKRGRLAAIVGGWIEGCAKSGFQAVEPDNLDSYQRSGGRLTQAGNAAYATLLARTAHASGLAIGQKNTAEMLPDRKKTGFDFAVAEECAEYNECGAYAKAYADRVFVIEYDTRNFKNACTRWGSSLSIVQRDLDVTPRGSDGYTYRSC
ncbi:endo alpha-1,4 polygalactosaminidase [Streptomyces sp. NPDC052040]|uniref:endo alpha-1,4 polygalactosaminidase n=1 Tax=Streptomyces sp. NPDC052040 TaxID=3365682 RepID=UPI0037D92DAB